MEDNLEYSQDWLTQEIIKTHFKEKETGVKEQIIISKVDLLRTMIKLLKLNQGE